VKEIVVAVALVGAATCAVLLLGALARAPAVVAGLILLHLGIFTLIDPGEIITVASITIYPGDIVYGLVAGAAFVRILGLPRMALPQLFVVTLAGLALFSVARGVGVDAASTLNEFRSPFYFLAAALYFVTVEPTKEFLRTVTYLFYTAAFLILSAAVVLWAAYLTGASLPEIIADPNEGGFRVVHADHAIVIAQACLMALYSSRLRDGRGRSFERVLPFVFIPSIVLLQWRVVWIAFFVGLVVGALRSRTLVAKALIPVAGTATVALLVLPMIFAGGDTPSFENTFEERLSTADTFFWRVEGWRELTDDGAESASEIVLGAPYGRGFDRVVAGRDVTTQPHSFYLNHYLRHGLIGLAALLLLYFWVVRHLKDINSDRFAAGLANPNILLMLVASQLVLFITFSPSSEQGLIVGIAAGVMLNRRGNESPEGPQAPEPGRMPC
jgi:hypothetical protein